MTNYSLTQVLTVLTLPWDTLIEIDIISFVEFVITLVVTLNPPTSLPYS